MHTDKKYINYTWFMIMWVFLVIIAGGVVRTTQSGMGCPDWPTCFGRWIPPTDASQLPADFEKYLKTQDIDHTFNVYHTWVEAINRYLGAFLGIIVFIHLIWSFRKYWKKNRPVVYLSLLLLLAVGFQGWLGKKVVDANLAVVKVTTHMLVALFIAAIPMMIIYRLSQREKIDNKLLKYVSTGLILVLLLQIVMGTQVREQIDEISKPLGYQHRELWINQLGNIFLVHRSFSWLVLAACIILYIKARPFPTLQKNSILVIACCTTAILAGLVMAFAHIPSWAQPLHLTLASILVVAVFSFRLKLK